jgi:hypothetical protein
LEGVGGVAFCDAIKDVHFLDTLRSWAAFADGGVAGISDLVLTIGINDESSGKQSIDDLGAGAAAQGGRQGFDVAVWAAGGGFENGGLGIGEFGLSGHVDLRWLVGVVTRRH